MEKRLIDANALKKALMKPFNWNNSPEEIQEQNDFRYFKVMIDAAPTIDAVPVVRCKDCTYSRSLNEKERHIFVNECMACTNPHGCGVKYPEYDIDDRIVTAHEYCFYGAKRQEKKPQRVCPTCGAKMDGGATE